MNEKYQQCMDDHQDIKIQFNLLSIASTPSSSLNHHESHINNDINATSSSIEHGHDSSEDEKTGSHPPFDKNKMRAMKINTVIAFDYDDTIFPTTFIKKIFKRNNAMNNISKWNYHELMDRINLDEFNELMSLSYMTYNLLMNYISNYSMENIFIVSAACHGWIKHSLSIVKDIGCYKQISEILTNSKLIKCYRDASGIDSKTNKFDATKYKYNKFELILNYKQFIFSDNYKNEKKGKFQINTFVSIGDSCHEYHAAGQVKCIHNNNNRAFFVHRVKMVDHPSLNKLFLEQYKLCNSCRFFEDYSFSYKKDIDEDYKHWLNKVIKSN